MDIGLIFIQHRYLFYLIFFIIALIEGPIISFTLGYFSNIYDFNLIIIYFIAFLGDFVGDLLHYFIGKYFNNIKFIHNKIKKIKIEPRKNLFLNIFLLKLTPPLTSAGLLYIGYKQTNFRKFILNGFLLSIIFSAGFVSLGRFSGITVGVFDLIYSEYISILLKFIMFVVFIFLILKYEPKLRNFFKKIMRGNNNA